MLSGRWALKINNFDRNGDLSHIQAATGIGQVASGALASSFLLPAVGPFSPAEDPTRALPTFSLSIDDENPLNSARPFLRTRTHMEHDSRQLGDICGFVRRNAHRRGRKHVALDVFLQPGNVGALTFSAAGRFYHDWNRGRTHHLS